MAGNSRTRCRALRGASVACLLALCGGAQVSAAAGKAATIHRGAIELSVGASMTTVEGITNGTVTVRGGIFWSALGELVTTEIGGAYRHPYGSLDQFDLEVGILWQRRWKKTGAYPHVGFTLGVRREEVGSFGTSRYPLGATAGFRALVGQRAGFRLDYRLRRVLNDPVADFTEHEVILGLSLFFRNEGREK